MSLKHASVLPPIRTRAAEMLRLTSSFLHRNQLSREILPEKICDVKDFSWLSSFVSRFGFSTVRPDFKSNGSNSGKTFASYAIFKGKSALFVYPVSPTFCKIDSGNSMLDKKGVVMLKFMPAIGQRKYDRERRQLFALSATEVGCLISLDPAESCEFFHDPSMKSSLEGQVKKTLTIAPLNEGNGYMFNLSVMNSNLKTNERFSVPVSKAEFAAMRSACSFALPHLMGWDRVVSSQLEVSSLKPVHLNKQDAPKQRLDPDYEWER